MAERKALGIREQRGYAMVALLVMMAVMAVAMTVALPAWSTMARREKEAELVFSRRAVRARNCALSAPVRRSVSTDHRRPGRGTLPAEEIQGPDHQRRFQDDCRRRSGRTGADNRPARTGRCAWPCRRTGSRTWRSGDRRATNRRPFHVHARRADRAGRTDRRSCHLHDRARPRWRHHRARWQRRWRRRGQRRDHGRHQQERGRIDPRVQGRRPLPSVALHCHAGQRAGRRQGWPQPW
jgi:hypothetical protein